MTRHPRTTAGSQGAAYDADDRPIVVLVEWEAPEMGLDEAEVMARDALAVLRNVPGLDEARIFGDFESGRHYFLLIWHDGAAMDRYMAGDAMQAVRGAALPFVAGKPDRRVFIDYGAVRGSKQAAPDAE